MKIFLVPFNFLSHGDTIAEGENRVVCKVSEMFVWNKDIYAPQGSVVAVTETGESVTTGGSLATHRYVVLEMFDPDNPAYTRNHRNNWPSMGIAEREVESLDAAFDLDFCGAASRSLS